MRRDVQELGKTPLARKAAKQFGTNPKGLMIFIDGSGESADARGSMYSPDEETRRMSLRARRENREAYGVPASKGPSEKPTDAYNQLVEKVNDLDAANARNTSSVAQKKLMAKQLATTPMFGKPKK